jgi:hypothetical protein
MTFHVEDAGAGSSRLITQTRVAATDVGAERAFARYWRVIYRAIKARAEAGATSA